MSGFLGGSAFDLVDLGWFQGARGGCDRYSGRLNVISTLICFAAVRIDTNSILFSVLIFGVGGARGALRTTGLPYTWVFKTGFLGRPEIVDFWGLGGLGGPKNPSRRWGASPLPPFGCRGRPGLKNQRFPAGPKTRYKKPKCKDSHPTH